MSALEVKMIQYDCPFIDATADHDISFFAKQWDFDAVTRVLETRFVATGRTSQELEQGLDALRNHPNFENLELLRQKDKKALIRSQVSETSAMEAIRDNDGYIIGPFEVQDGSEMWRVGFDSKENRQNALADLDKNNDFTITSNMSFDFEEYHGVFQNIETASEFLSQCRNLSQVERKTLITAVDEGYFMNPREATLSTLADAFDISKTAVSKNLRRGQRKVLGEVVRALSTVESQDNYSTRP